jgi:hypothetical protein
MEQRQTGLKEDALEKVTVQKRVRTLADRSSDSGRLEALHEAVPLVWRGWPTYRPAPLRAILGRVFWSKRMSWIWIGLLSLGLLSLGLLSLGLLSGCAVPQVSAEQRLFLDLSVTLIGEAVLPQQDFEGTQVGGLSALTYDIRRNQFYALSDDRGKFGSPRFYRLDLAFNLSGINDISVTGVTLLKDASGQPYPPEQLDPEGMALTPRETLLISSEGSPAAGIAPAMGEFDLASGQLKTTLRLPERYLPNRPQTQGVQENLSLEALTINVAPGTVGYTEPFRLFVATEGPLRQDLDLEPEIPFKNRFLHYLIGQDQAMLLSEHWYPMDGSPLGAVLNGLSEILVLDQGGHFLAMERAFGLQGFMVKLYQLATGGASDISAIATLQGDLSALSPIRKQLLLNLNDLNIPLDNLEGMTLGPKFADGSQSLILVSDNNFDDRQRTQFLLFQLQGLPG